MKAFYAAVHWVECLRASEGGHSAHHADRNHYIRDRHPAIYSAYSRLLYLSQLARYESTKDFYGHIDLGDIHADIIDGLLASIEVYVGHLSQPSA